MNKEKVIDLTGEKSASVKLMLPKNVNAVVVDDQVVMIEINNNPLDLVPKSWEEFCENNKCMQGEFYLSDDGVEIVESKDWERNKDSDKRYFATQEDAEAFLALVQLRRLWHEWVDVFGLPTENKSCGIHVDSNGREILIHCVGTGMLRFKEKTQALRFVECFGDLLEKAKTLL